jgi:hypothetical protein
MVIDDQGDISKAVSAAGRDGPAQEARMSVTLTPPIDRMVAAPGGGNAKPFPGCLDA